MKLYHGSNLVIESINLAMCRPYKDFGRGFYLTDMKEQAEKMAVRVSRIYGGSPVVNAFEIPDSFRTISGNPRQFNYRDESAGLCISAQSK